MKRFGPVVLAACCLVVAGSEVCAQDIRWFDNYSAAMEEAVRADKPLFVSFRCVP